MKIKFYIYLAKRVGWFIGAFKRTQTRLLSQAQFHGWQPEGEEATTRLARDQFHLYLFRKNKAEIKKLNQERLWKTTSK